MQLLKNYKKNIKQSTTSVLPVASVKLNKLLNITFCILLNMCYEFLFADFTKFEPVPKVKYLGERQVILVAAEYFLLGIQISLIDSTHFAKVTVLF